MVGYEQGEIFSGERWFGNKGKNSLEICQADYLKTSKIMKTNNENLLKG
jgi:hypothetical protein